MIMHWIVQYEEDGRLYTYDETEEKFTDRMTSRLEYGREPPYRIWAVIAGELKQVNMTIPE